MDVTPQLIEELVGLVKAGAKYQAITDDLVRELGRRELAKRSSLKEAVKETRNKLHQVGGSYQEKPIPYADWRQSLADLPENLQDPQTGQFVKQCMQQHASTAERLSILPDFYSVLLAGLGPIQSVLDLACGLNPLALPWMPLAQDAHYTACDIYEDMTSFIGDFFKHFKIAGSAFTCDLTRSVPQVQAQLALLLKTIPCLDQVDKNAAPRLLRGLQAETILVSFPGCSLGGRGKGMKANYEARFNEIIEGEPWKVARFDFPNELAFLIRK